MALADSGQIYGDDIQTQLKKRVTAQAQPGAQPTPALSPSADVPTSGYEPVAPPVAAAPPPAPSPVAQNAAPAPANVPWDPNGFAQIVGRAPTQAETDFYSKVPTWQTDVKNAAGGGQPTTPGTFGVGYQAPTATGSAGPAGAPAWTGNAQEWVNGQLSAVQSTDDPNYWYQKISADPKAMAGDPSALAYWQDRIERGNGSALVKNGTKSLFNDTGTGTPGNAPAVSPFTQGIRDILMKRLAAAQGPVDPNSPEIAQPFEAAKLQSDRGAQQANAIAAEQAYAASAKGGGGVDTGALARQGQQAVEQQSMGLAGIKSTLIQKAYAQKQNELQSDLQYALASGDAETARQIQVELANLQATLTREGYGIQLANITNQQNTAPFSLFG